MNNHIIDRLTYLKKVVPVRQILQDNEPVVVLLDPGHGGLIDSKYVTAPNKMAKHPFGEFYEGLWNRVVVWAHAQKLFLSKHNYHIIVPEDKDVTVYERVRRAEAIARELKGKYKCYYHSVHGNAFGLADVNGVEVYTSPGWTKSDAIATLYYQQLFKLGWKMRPDWSDGDPDKEERFYVLMNTTMPSILSETGFYTNPQEVQKMIQLGTINNISDLFLHAHNELLKLKLL